MTLGEVVREGIWFIGSLWLDILTFTVGPLPIGAVGFVLLTLVIFAYAVDPPMHV